MYIRRPGSVMAHPKSAPQSYQGLGAKLAILLIITHGSTYLFFLRHLRRGSTCIFPITCCVTAELQLFSVCPTPNKPAPCETTNARRTNSLNLAPLSKYGRLTAPNIRFPKPQLPHRATMRLFLFLHICLFRTRVDMSMPFAMQ
jgi:hypothetical protein